MTKQDDFKFMNSKKNLKKKLKVRVDDQGVRIRRGMGKKKKKLSLFSQIVSKISIRTIRVTVRI